MQNFFKLFHLFNHDILFLIFILLHMFVDTAFSMFALAKKNINAGFWVAFETNLDVFTTGKMLILISKVSPSTLLFVFMTNSE